MEDSVLFECKVEYASISPGKYLRAKTERTH